MNYTKGNWKVTLGGVDMPENRRLIVAELGEENGIMNIRTICKTLDYGEPAEMIANARLIAAAPDMYEALKAAYVSLIEDEHYQHFKPLMVTIVNAINKAEGK